MVVSYFNSTTSGTTPASVINTDGRSIVIRKILVGNPVSSGNLTIHNTNNALAQDTTTIAMKLTYPAFSTTNVNDGPDTYDFRCANGGSGSTEADGLVLGMGGSLVMDQTMQVTVFWDYTEGN